ncbi:pleiotropic regulator of exopolysaccharide synthesis, competence and biofilm formation [Streptococcus phage Javan508]|uniref:Putative repressor protein-phage-associated n=1 Tax=Streptococcus pyogenes serotype M3 (strain ATCC BAA-595 / MGAS315) TaxID=198466 RepID=A0A0H2UVP7_STRP3|nr:S24 family peptidase [Streptococcus pyogenes]NP_795430.1 putative repressor protein [Streptococcus phage 315.2]AAM79584.1 putative repressor protein - phage-associated [Streptococcus pyogenes MGAS315]QBX29680.1 pleiotropic regulator of exopolysaccharide synthesis, competence and biofilm formation [Streptococcus phage Javan508]
MARGRGKLTPQDEEYKKIISAKINSLLLENNLKQGHLADALEIPRSSFNEYVKGNSLPNPGNVQKIADYFGLMKSDIDPRFAPRKKNHELKIPTSPLVKKITTTVVELKVPRKQKVLDFATEQLKEQKNKITSIEKKLYEYKVYEKLSAGTGYGYFGDGNYDTVFYDEELDYDFASWVFGDSMEPTYLNGEVVLIKQTGFDYEGGIYAVEWDGQTYIKKVYREKGGLRLVSLNKKYNDKFAPFSEGPRVIGEIVGNFMPKEY